MPSASEMAGGKLLAGNNWRCGRGSGKAAPMLPDPFSPPTLLLLFGAGLWAGTQNALAGGGSFVTLPALILAGLDPKLANITSTMALFPGQITTGLAGRQLISGAERLSFRTLAIITLCGGVAGAYLLIATPVKVFASMVPWLVLAATLLFAWSSWGRRSGAAKPPPPGWVTGLTQSGISIYSGFFGGGAGILLLAALSFARMPVKNAAGTKNMLMAISNVAAAVVFAFSGAVAWSHALVLGLGAMTGGYAGARMLQRLPDNVLRVGVVVIGTALTVGLFWRL